MQLERWSITIEEGGGVTKGLSR